MESNQTNTPGLIEKLALLTDAAESLFPDGKMVVVFELNSRDFEQVQNNFQQVDKTIKQFKIDISGTEFIFLQDKLLSDETNKTSETPF